VQDYGKLVAIRYQKLLDQSTPHIVGNLSFNFSFFCFTLQTVLLACIIQLKQLLISSMGCVSISSGSLFSSSVSN
jgi:hypothetical protein